MCTRCIMDTTDSEIVFDDLGICNHCRRYDEIAARKLFNGQMGERKLQEIAAAIKAKGKGREYDSIIGLSGGVDSSFTAYQAWRLGLRPLVVHFDNGWNSEVSVRNIENVVRKLGFDLHTYVIDWEEFKDLQLSFLKASVIDIEMLTDHAMMAAMFNLARERNIRHILSGTNVVTEGIMPRSWLYSKWDIKNIKGIQKQFGNVRLKEFPTCGLIKMLVLQYLRGYHYVEILNYLDYHKKEAIEILRNQLGWQTYGGKHHESIFTKFYQNYILPTKFGVDKRRAHLSTLICSGQMTRAQALEEMNSPLYDEEDLRRDKAYVLKKLGLDEEAFEGLMCLPIKSHTDYPNSQWLLPVLAAIREFVKGDGSSDIRSSG